MIRPKSYLELSPADQDAAVAEYIQGHPTTDIGKKYGLGKGSVRNLLLHRGTPLRPCWLSRMLADHRAGERFGRLALVKPSGEFRGRWECRCDCGETVYRKMGALVTGNTSSCGCLRREDQSFRNITHGATRGSHLGAKRAPGYHAWVSMHRRCSSQAKGRERQDYYDRGIRVCLRWRESFAAFVAVLGDRPSGQHSIDRIDNDKGYTCGECEECRKNGWRMNCRWATRSEQRRNTRDAIRVTYNGETLPLADWCTRLDKPYALVTSRLRRGMSVAESFTRPAPRRRDNNDPTVQRQRLHSIWRGMIDRCTNPLNPGYANYGGRGIRVCKRWLGSFRLFAADMTPRLSPAHTLHRVNNDGPYSRSNCVWADRITQVSNRRPPKPAVRSLPRHLIA